MADTDPDADDVVQIAQKLWQRDKEAWGEVYQHALNDLDFQNPDKEGAQWDPTDYQSRIDSRRPALTIDQLSQFVHQVANDIRMNTPSINIIPAGNKADDETAEVYKGLIRNIEYRSAADEVYDNASLSSIRCSLGFIQIDHDYTDEEGFEQELLIKRVNNPLACWIDADSIECDGRDAKHGTILDPILVSQFKKEYPGKDPVSFSDDEVHTDYKDEDIINIAHFFRLKEETRDIGVDELGATVDYVEGMDKKRTLKKTIVERYKMSGKDVLEKTTFPGKYIPIVPVYGEENWINGRRHLLSLIRRAKDPQRMQNYWASLETELLQKMPNAPVMAAAGQLDDYADDWRNPAKAFALRYKATDSKSNPLPPPQRLEPPTIPTGIVNARREAIEDIKASMGLYNASIGARSNETSGIAIQRRQQEGDVATFHFGDNLVRSITQVGRILVCAIPEIYDTPRIIRIIGVEDEPKEVGINGQMAEEQERPFNLVEGKYDVRVITGPSFTTQRQETATYLQELFVKMPDLMPVLGDIFFKNSDFSGAQAMAERIKKTMNPALLEGDKDAPPPDPEKEQMKVQMAQMIEEMKKLQMESQSKQGELEIKRGDLAIKEAELRLKYLQAAKEDSAPKQPAVNDNGESMQPENIEQLALQIQQQIEQLQQLRLAEESRIAQEQQIIDQQREKQQQEEQMRAAEIQLRIDQGNAVLQTLNGISQNLASLTATVKKPKTVKYNPDGTIAGVQ